MNICKYCGKALDTGPPCKDHANARLFEGVPNLLEHMAKQEKEKLLQQFYNGESKVNTGQIQSTQNKEKVMKPVIEITPLASGFQVRFSDFRGGCSVHAAETYTSATAKAKKLLDDDLKKQALCAECK